MSPCFFFGRRPKRFWNGRKKLSHFGQNVWKCRLRSTVLVSFNTSVIQMTEMFQWPKCLKKWPKRLKKPAVTTLHATTSLIRSSGVWHLTSEKTWIPIEIVFGDYVSCPGCSQQEIDACSERTRTTHKPRPPLGCNLRHLTLVGLLLAA